MNKPGRRRIKKDTLVLGIIHPQVEDYFQDYCKSLQSQDDLGFDTLILNDNCERFVPLNDERWKYINIKKNLTPAQIKHLGVRYAIENNYNYLVFSDLDDYFSKNRILLSKEKLKEFDFVYNELNLTNVNGEIIKNNYLSSIGIKGICDTYLYILDNNLFGLSHTAVRVEKLRYLFIPNDVIAVDWWIFTLLLLNGCKGSFAGKAITYYRQSENNLVGMGKQLNRESLQLGIEVKTNHYINLISYCSENKLKSEKTIFNEKLEEIEELRKSIKNTAFCKRYLEVINANFNKISKGWWSKILPLKEWENYAE